MTTTVKGVDDALAYLRVHAEEHLAGLDAFLRMPSISADPERRDEMRRTAQWIAATFVRLATAALLGPYAAV